MQNTKYLFFTLSFLFLFSFSQSQNMIKNGDFNGLSFWNFHEGSSTSTVGISMGEAFIDISVAGTNSWEPQLGQYNIIMKAGTEYKLAFKAHASNDRTINANIGTGPPNYTSIFSKTVLLHQTAQWYTYTFTAGISDSTSGLNFDCGQDINDVYIDSVSLFATTIISDKYIISGKITYSDSFTPFAGVNVGMEIHNLAGIIDTILVTDAKGEYMFPMDSQLIVEPFPINITPSYAGFTFSPKKHYFQTTDFNAYKNNNFIANSEALDICIVLVDSNTNRNLVAWERYHSTEVDSYRIYRETTVANKYELIGSTDYNEISVVIDTASNPKQRAYRYGLTVIDIFGTESKMSNVHKTIHLTANAGAGSEINLIWSAYEGFYFSTYKIYRGTSPSKMTLLDSIQSTLFSYTDVSPPTGLVFYQVVVQKQDTCYPDIFRAKTSKGPFTQSFSNMEDYSTITGDYLEVYPENKTLSKTKGEYTFSVFTNLLSWNLSSNQSWLSYQNDMANKSFKLFFDENTTGSDRTAKITLSAAGVTDVILNITQSKDIVSIEEEANNNVLIYPNPVNDVLHINSTSFVNSYEMYSIHGQQVLAGKINGHEAQINVTSFPSGIYNLRMISGEKVVTKCFIHR